MSIKKEEERIYKKRIEKLLKVMEKEKAGLYVVSNPGNIKYLCCYKFPKEPPLTYLIITSEGEKIGITSSLEGFRARETTYVDELHTFCTYRLLGCKYRLPMDAVRDLIIKFAPEKTLTDGKFLSRKTKVVHDNSIRKMRKIKDEIEINNIHKAARVVDNGYYFLKENIKPGITELKMVNELNHFLRDQKGVTNLSFETIIATGTHSAYSHHDPTNTKIMNGDAVICDFGVIVDGYCSDMTRSFLIGNTSNKLKRIFDLVQRAQKKAMEMVKVGEPLKILDLTARRMFEKEGYGAYYPHSLGHGVGLDIHEDPLGIRPTIKGKQEAGMVITIEPGIYIPGLGGVRLEDDILITEKGAKLLTLSPHDPYI